MTKPPIDPPDPDAYNEESKEREEFGREPLEKPPSNGREPFSKIALWESLSLTMGKNSPHINLDNACRVLAGSPSLSEAIWFDEFKKRTITTWKGKLREWSDTDDLSLLSFFQNEISMPQMKKEIVRDAIDLHAHRHAQNEFHAWLGTLKWDNIERIASFFQVYMGANDSEYIRAVSHNFWCSLIARGIMPGCQADNMVILEGAQGVYKSSALRTIGGHDWFSELHGSVKDKDFLMSLQGKLLLEIGEMDSFNRAEIDQIKGMITNRVDRFRGAYERRTMDHPRTCIFVGTTNEETYLRDVTGGRRFWPIKVGVGSPIDVDRIKKDRGQLYAEAFYRLRHGAKWWEVPESAKEEQEERRDRDAWEEKLADYIKLDVLVDEFTIRDLARDALDIKIDKLDMGTQKRIAKCLRAIGMKRVKSNGNFVWRQNQGPCCGPYTGPSTGTVKRE